MIRLNLGEVGVTAELGLGPASLEQARMMSCALPAAARGSYAVVRRIRAVVMRVHVQPDVVRDGLVLGHAVRGPRVVHELLHVRLEHLRETVKRVQLERLDDARRRRCDVHHLDARRLSRCWTAPAGHRLPARARWAGPGSGFGVLEGTEGGDRLHGYEDKEEGQRRREEREREGKEEGQRT